MITEIHGLENLAEAVYNIFDNDMDKAGFPPSPPKYRHLGPYYITIRIAENLSSR